jgi:mRNA-degrading endonuclease RelE of RelBE toxin-antitoxin system
MSQWIKFISLFTVTVLTGCYDEEVTVSRFMDGEQVYNTISFDDRLIIYSDDRDLAYHDRDSTEPTFRIRSGGVGVNYSILDEKKNILGFVVDANQDGILDLKFRNDGQQEVWLGGRWNVLYSDTMGEYIILNAKKCYLAKDKNYGLYHLK